MKKQQYIIPETTTVHVAAQQILSGSGSLLPGSPDDGGEQPDQDSDGHYIAE